MVMRVHGWYPAWSPHFWGLSTVEDLCHAVMSLPEVAGGVACCVDDELIWGRVTITDFRDHRTIPFEPPAMAPAEDVSKAPSALLEWFSPMMRFDHLSTVPCKGGFTASETAIFDQGWYPDRRVTTCCPSVAWVGNQWANNFWCGAAATIRTRSDSLWLLMVSAQLVRWSPTSTPINHEVTIGSFAKMDH